MVMMRISRKLGVLIKGCPRGLVASEVRVVLIMIIDGGDFNSKLSRLKWTCGVNPEKNSNPARNLDLIIGQVSGTNWRHPNQSPFGLPEAVRYKLHCLHLGHLICPYGALSADCWALEVKDSLGNND